MIRILVIPVESIGARVTHGISREDADDAS